MPPPRQPTKSRQLWPPPQHARDLKQAARELTAKSLQRLEELLDSPDDKVVLGAIKEIHDRGWGKAMQIILTDEIPKMTNAEKALLALAAPVPASPSPSPSPALEPDAVISGPVGGADDDDPWAL